MSKQDKINRILNEATDAHETQYPDLIDKFNDHLVMILDKTGNEHHFRNLNNIKILMQQRPGLNWKDLGEKDVRKLLVEIENRDVSTKTKNKYRGALNKYLEMQDKTWDELTPKGVVKYQGTSDDPTDRDLIPNPEEVKKFLREAEQRSDPSTRLRNLAFLFTLWDTGARSNGLAKAPMKKENDVEIHEETVKVTIYPTKESPRRKLDCFFAAPVLKKYLENHPRPESDYLFPNLQEERNQDAQNASQKTEAGHINKSSIRDLARSCWETLTESEVVEVEFFQQPLHILRKSNKTWFNNMDLLDESDLDIRAGHVIGSQHTRKYTRKDEQDANAALRKNLGVEDEETREWEKVLWPRKCSSCSTRNSGHRISCHSCGKNFSEEDLPEGTNVKENPEEQAQEAAQKVMEEILEANPELTEELADKHGLKK